MPPLIVSLSTVRCYRGLKSDHHRRDLGEILISLGPGEPLYSPVDTPQRPRSRCRAVQGSCGGRIAISRQPLKRRGRFGAAPFSRLANLCNHAADALSRPDPLGFPLQLRHVTQLSFGLSFGIPGWTGNESISRNPSRVPILDSCTAHGAFKTADLARLSHVLAAIINRAAFTGPMTRRF
jgi:hypothetical protein